MTDTLTRLNAARDFLRDWCPDAPHTALVLGSGYAALGREVAGAMALSYREIPDFPTPTNPAHPGKLLVGELAGQRVAVLQGRIHCYEGYCAEDVVFPVRALAMWGVQSFILTNAAGAIHPDYAVGEFMAITDHLNFMGQNPLSGRNLEMLGTRFPDMTYLYDRRMIVAALEAAERAGIRCHQGVYAAMAGPSYETPAEIRMLRTVGADAVGMSTVPEAIALRHLGRRVFGLSCLTNLAAGCGQGPLSDAEVIEALSQPKVQQGLRAIIAGVIDAAR